MPTYEYECDKCREVFEIRQRISEPALTVHAECGGAVRRLLSAAPFILKGDGWYVSDYPSEARKKGVASETKAGETKAAETAKPAAAEPAKSSTSSTASAGASAPSSASSSSSPT